MIYTYINPALCDHHMFLLICFYRMFLRWIQLIDIPGQCKLGFPSRPGSPPAAFKIQKLFVSKDKQNHDCNDSCALQSCVVLENWFKLR